MATLFKRAKKAVAPPPEVDDSAERGISTARVRELLAQVDAEEAAAASVEPVGQGNQQWRRRITRAEAEVIKRQMIGPMRRHFMLSERREFLEQYEVIADEPMPIPESPTHHAEILAARAAATKPPAPTPKRPNRIVAAARVLLGVDEPPQAEPKPKKPANTFFTHR